MELDESEVEVCADIVGGNYFSRQSVTFIQSHEKKRQHQDDHEHDRTLAAECAPCKYVRRNTERGGYGEADQLTFCQVEHQFCFDFAEIFGDWHKWHKITSLVRFVLVAKGNLKFAMSFIRDYLLAFFAIYVYTNGRASREYRFCPFERGSLNGKHIG